MNAASRFRTAAVMVGLIAAVAALVAVQVRGVGADTKAAAEPWPVMPSASARVDIGLTTTRLAQNSWRAWKPSDLVTVNAWEQSIRHHASIVMWYADWTTGPPPLRQLEAVAERRSIPEITWEPWRSFRTTEERARHPDASVRKQPRYRLRNIISGKFDPYIRGWARRLAAYGRPVRLRFAQEMNGGWYPWSERANENRRGDFVRAWRHVHRIFRAAGATNVSWVWGPAAITIRRGQYPGDAYVDIVGLTVFNGGLQLRYNRWRPFAAAVRRPLRQLHEIAPRKPIELSEVGSGEEGGRKSSWIAGMFATLRRHPQIASLIWFDVVKGTDWRIASSPSATKAFANGVAGRAYR